VQRCQPERYLTLLVGLRGHGWRRRTVLAGATARMALPGLGLASTSTLWPVLTVAVIGTVNPSTGDFAGAFGALAAALSAALAHARGWSMPAVGRAVFLGYAGVAVMAALV
jgi:hypothetical protein